jgi:hypothetical protein
MKIASTDIAIIDNNQAGHHLWTLIYSFRLYAENFLNTCRQCCMKPEYTPAPEGHIGDYTGIQYVLVGIIFTDHSALVVVIVN